MRILRDLNLNGPAPARAQPKVGEWGPVKVPSTKWKKWQRVIVILAFIAVTTVVVLVGRYFYLALTDQLDKPAPTPIITATPTR